MNENNNIYKENLISNINLGKPLFFRVDLHIVGGCNFGCIMCDNRQNPVIFNFNNSKLYETILKLNQKYNCNYIRIHGQEPTLYKDLDKIILFANKLGIKTAIKTNGWLLSKNRIEKILDSGLDEIYISIDGPNSDIHDKIRNKIGSFIQIQKLISQIKNYKKNTKIYINSVIMLLNYKIIDKMLDFGNKLKIDRISFVFLNNKNSKDINRINLGYNEFLYFFQKKIPLIFKKSIKYDIEVDFSPFISSLLLNDKKKIISELSKNFEKYKIEIKNFYNGEYGKTFYDKYGCFGPYDHCSINFDGEMYGCCVIERDFENSVGNILNEDIYELWNKNKYIEYRKNSNKDCQYSQFCGSNFLIRKNLFKSIFFDENLYTKDDPQNYYRYLKQIFYTDKITLNLIKLNKVKQLIIKFLKKNNDYTKLLIDNGINENLINSATDLKFFKKIPILDKKIISNFDIPNFLGDQKYFKGKTSGSNCPRFEFYYPDDFKRYVKLLAIMSEGTGFTFKDNFFSLTPLNCDNINLNNIKLPEFVKKFNCPNIFDFDLNNEKGFNEYKLFFEKNQNIEYLHTDPKYLLFIVIGFKKYKLNLPKLKGINLTYSFTNKALLSYFKNNFNCEIINNYGCSEIGPISLNNNIFGDNIIIETLNDELIISDLDNDIFPFIRYKNGDLGKIKNDKIEFLGRKSEMINGKNLYEIDKFIYKNFPSIIAYQFNDIRFDYISFDKIDENLTKFRLSEFVGIALNFLNVKDSFFEIGTCGKFKTIINKG